MLGQCMATKAPLNWGGGGVQLGGTIFKKVALWALDMALP